MNIIATITATAMTAMIRAYSTSPCPESSRLNLDIPTPLRLTAGPVRILRRLYPVRQFWESGIPAPSGGAPHRSAVARRPSKPSNFEVLPHPGGARPDESEGASLLFIAVR